MMRAELVRIVSGVLPLDAESTRDCAPGKLPGAHTVGVGHTLERHVLDRSSGV